MRISDWSSDVCSSDLARYAEKAPFALKQRKFRASPPQGFSATVALTTDDPGFWTSLAVSCVFSWPFSMEAESCATSPQLARHSVCILARFSFALAIEIGRAHVRTPVTNAQLVCRLTLE